MADALNHSPHRPGQHDPSGDRTPVAGIAVVIDLADPRAAVLRASGEIDMLTAPVLADRVSRYFAESTGPYRPLVFDLGGVGFLGSAGLAVLAAAAVAAAEHEGAVWVVAPTRVVLRPLQVTGLDGVLQVRTDVDTALAEAGGPVETGGSVEGA